MSKYGDRSERAADSGGSQKISDLIPTANDEVICLLVGVENKEGKDGNTFRIWSLFSEDLGEIILSGSGSNFGKVFDKAVTDKLFNPHDMPLLAIGNDRPPNDWERIDQRSGQMVTTRWHNVYIEQVRPKSAEQMAALQALKKRAFAEMQTPPIADGKPYAPAVANAGRSIQQELNQVYANEEIPF
jgi:hypothetical protein